MLVAGGVAELPPRGLPRGVLVVHSPLNVALEALLGFVVEGGGAAGLYPGPVPLQGGHSRFEPAPVLRRHDAEAFQIAESLNV